MLRALTVVAAGGWSGDPADSVVLDFDGRYRRRVTMKGVRGLEFLLDLDEAVMLRGGDGLKLEDGRVVEVVAAPEPLAELRASEPAALARLAWHLGNRHLPVELTRKALRIRRDPVIEEMARGLGATVLGIEAPFNPEGGAYAKGGHDPHGHDHHGHDHHGHDHGHHGHDHHGHDHHGHDHHGHDHDHHGHDHDHEHCGHDHHGHDHKHGGHGH